MAVQFRDGVYGLVKEFVDEQGKHPLARQILFRTLGPDLVATCYPGESIQPHLLAPPYVHTGGVNSDVCGCVCLCVCGCSLLAMPVRACVPRFMSATPRRTCVQPGVVVITRRWLTLPCACVPVPVPVPVWLCPCVCLCLCGWVGMVCVGGSSQ